MTKWWDNNKGEVCVAHVAVHWVHSDEQLWRKVTFQVCFAGVCIEVGPLQLIFGAKVAPFTQLEAIVRSPGPKRKLRVWLSNTPSIEHSGMELCVVIRLLLRRDFVHKCLSTKAPQSIWTCQTVIAHNVNNFIPSRPSVTPNALLNEMQNFTRRESFERVTAVQKDVVQNSPCEPPSKASSEWLPARRLTSGIQNPRWNAYICLCAPMSWVSVSHCLMRATKGRHDDPTAAVLASHVNPSAARPALYHSYYALSEVSGEVAVNEGIHAGVGGPQPLRQRLQIALHDHFLRGPRRRPEHGPKIQRVQRQPGQGEDYEDNHEHAHNFDLGAVDVALRSRPAHTRHLSLPHSDADQKIKDGDEEKRQKVAGEEHDAQHVRLSDVRTLPAEEEADSVNEQCAHNEEGASECSFSLICSSFFSAWRNTFVIYIYHDHPLSTAMAFHSHSNSHSQSYHYPRWSHYPKLGIWPRLPTHNSLWHHRGR